MVVPVRLRPSGPKLFQCIRPKGAECKKPLGLKYTPDLRKYHVQRIAPLQHEATENDVHTGVGEGQAHRVSAHALKAAKQTLATLCLAEHPRGHIERNNERTTISGPECFCGPAGSGAQVNNDIGLKFEELEPFHQLIAHPRLHGSSRVVSRACPIERRADAGSVELERILATLIGWSHRATARNFLRARAFMRLFFAGRGAWPESAMGAAGSRARVRNCRTSAANSARCDKNGAWAARFISTKRVSGSARASTAEAAGGVMRSC